MPTMSVKNSLTRHNKTNVIDRQSDSIVGVMHSLIYTQDRKNDVQGLSVIGDRKKSDFQLFAIFFGLINLIELVYGIFTTSSLHMICVRTYELSVHINFMDQQFHGEPPKGDLDWSEKYFFTDSYKSISFFLHNHETSKHTETISIINLGFNKVIDTWYMDGMNDMSCYSVICIILVMVMGWDSPWDRIRYCIPWMIFTDE